MEPAHLRRNPHQGTYDAESVKAVFDDCFIAHVSYVVDGLPACMPMIAMIMEDEDSVDLVPPGSDSITDADGLVQRQENGVKRDMAVYLHGHPNSKLMELVRQADREMGEIGNGVGETNGHGPTTSSSGKVKVCITATKVDGLVLSSAPNGHALNFRSATIHGTCEPVRSKDSKRKVMQAVTNKIVANRWEEVNPVASMQVALVYVIKVNIDAMSVKTRTGVPGIQPRNAEKDGADIQTPPWTGVIPLWEQLGEPVDSGLTPKAVVSESLRSFIDGRNQKHEAYSKHAAR